MITNSIDELISQLNSGEKPDPQALTFCLQTTGKDWLYFRESADKLRESTLGSEVHLRGIIEFSNYCKQNCLYCGLRRDNHHTRHYRLTPDEILAIARDAAQRGFKTIVLQSGEDPWYTSTELARLVDQIKSLDVAVTLSLGEHSKQDYLLWRNAGADRYLLKHETSDPKLFAHLRPGTCLENRLESLYTLKLLGYQTGSGNMVGLPGQTPETLIGDLLLLQQLDVEMAGIGPFIPHPDTPLGHYPSGSIDLTLHVLALARHLLPYTHMPATTAIHTLHPEGRRLALQSGANVIMPNVTPMQYRTNYQIYPKNNMRALEQELETLHSLLASLNRSISTDYGHAKTKYQQ